MVPGMPLNALSRPRPMLSEMSVDVKQAREAWPVALVTMPFVSLYRPSLQLGLLKSIATKYGFPTTTFHLNLNFAKHIGPELYETLCHHRRRLFSDWIFSIAAFGDEAPDPDDRLVIDFEDDLKRLFTDTGIDEKPDRLCTLRRTDVPSYLDHMMEIIPWERFRVVGFTSTFQQSVASFALAARIKKRFPNICTVFGGANFDGEMGLELVRAIECIDYAVIGEADHTFPELLIALQEDRDPAKVPGVVGRRDGDTTPLQVRPPFQMLDELPIPDYEEFFQRAEALDFLPSGGRRIVYLPFESSRGCWWGQKHHCTFCGLNGMTMTFRAKSPDRVLKELSEMSTRYRSFHFEAVDNIMDLSYLKQLLPRFVESGSDYHFFYEVKSNLTRQKIRVLSAGGVRRIQPGIESLSSHVLKLMNKGVTAIQNANTLRWAAYYNIEVGWNLIYGFPNETEDDYHDQLALLRQLRHLQPPVGAGRIWMERFSPIFVDRDSFPVRYMRPEASYTYVYPESIELKKVAYFFDYELEDTLPDSVYENTHQEIRAWQADWMADVRPTLTFWSAPGFLQIEDLRVPESPGTYTFRGPLAALYAACSDRPLPAAKLRQQLELPWQEDEIEAALDEYCVRGLMMREGKAFLSLALPASRLR